MTATARAQTGLSALLERAFRTRSAQFAGFLAVALLTRAPVFGDPYYHNDELLYFLIGQHMHQGALPYVDVWDRKGPGLFAVYYLIAGFGRSVLAYQIAACLFAAGTAMLVGRIAERFAGRLGAMLAGSFYLLMLPLYAGAGGQAPVFYNLFMALAFWLVLSRLDDLRAGRVDRAIPLAMVSAGFAVTFKQTALFESLFLGLTVLWQLRRGGWGVMRLLRTGAGLALAGAAPMLLFAALYALSGHFTELWHALVTANLTKSYDPGADSLKRARALALVASPLLIPALAGLLIRRGGSGQPVPRLLLAGWLGAALIGLVIIPNFIDHYMLPVLVPLAVMAAPALEWRMIGPAWALFAGLLVTMAGPTLKMEQRRASRIAMDGLVAEIRKHDPAPRLFVYQGPTSLYLLMNSAPPSPLLFPTHLFHAPERNTSHLDTAGEQRKILNWQPTTVVRYPDFPRDYLNRETAAMVDAYVARCRSRFVWTVIDYYGPQKVEVFTRCAEAGKP